MQTDRDVILSSSDWLKCQIKINDIIRDENCCLSYYIGDNYDIEVKKGDVNCDGLIDAVDATQVLMEYAELSTK